MLKTYSGSFWILSISSYLFFTSFTMIIAELPGYLSSLGGSEYLGLIISLFTLTAGLARPFSGKLTDRWGRVPVMIVGAVVSGTCALLYPIWATVPGLLIIRLLHGFSTGFTPTGLSAYVSDIVPAHKRGEALGIFSFFGSIGMASGPAMGSWIFLHYGLQPLFFVSCGFAIASIVILAGMKETLEEREPFHVSMLHITRADIFEPSVLVPSVVMLLTTASFGVVITLAPDFSTFVGVANKGLFFLFFTSSSLLVRVLGGQLSDRFGRRSVLYFSTLFLSISMTLLGFATTSFQFFTGAFLFGIGYGLNSPTLFAWAIDRSPNATRGRGISTIFIFLEMGIGVGALLGGTFYDGMPQRFPVIFAVAGVSSLLAFFYLLFTKRE